MVELHASNASVQAHLKPGSIVPLHWPDGGGVDVPQPKLNNTQALLAAPLTLVINRDDHQAAKGKVFLDRGETLSELSDKTYQYYELSLHQNTITKWTLNDSGNQTDVPPAFQAIVIANAPDLNDTDFACFRNTTSNETEAMFPEFDNNSKALNLTFINDNLTKSFFNMKSIHFGNRGRDWNLCASPDSANFIISSADFDLTGASAEATLQSYTTK